MPWPQTGATQYLAQVGLPDKSRAIKGLVVCYDWDLEPLHLLNGLALGCYQPSPELYSYRLDYTKCFFLNKVISFCMTTFIVVNSLSKHCKDISKNLKNRIMKISKYKKN